MYPGVRVGRVGIGIFYPAGKPILMHLLRYRAFAVDNHSCIPCASHLHQPRPVNNPGQLKRNVNQAFWLFTNGGEIIIVKESLKTGNRGGTRFERSS